MQHTYSLQAATSWQAPSAAMHIGVYGGRMTKPLSLVLFLLVVALFSEFKGLDGAVHPADRENPGNSDSEQPETLTSDTTSAKESGAPEQVETVKDEKDDSGTESADLAKREEDVQTSSSAACTTRVKKLWTKIKKWWRRNLSPASRTCKEVKEAGGVPSVSQGHSPIETFGYPVFDMKSSRLFLEPRIPLSVVNGYMQPIRVGASDYVIRGTLGEIVSFLECFENYEVIASTVDADGHWVSAPGHSNVALQLQNVAADYYGPLERNERLIELSLSMLTKVADTVRGELKTNLAKKLNSFLETIQKIGSKTQMQDLPNLLESLAECKGAEEVLQGVWEFVKHTVGWETLKDKANWIDSEAVDLTGVLTLTISSCPRPSHGVRATLVLPVNRTTLKDIRQTLPGVFSISAGDQEAAAI